jgi:hypothetical protein
MTTLFVDGDDLTSVLHQQDILVADMAEQSLTREVSECNALREIWSSGRCLPVSHVNPSIVKANDEWHAISSWQAKEFLKPEGSVAGLMMT